MFLHGLHYQRIFTVDGRYSDIVDGGDGDGGDDEEDEDYEDEDDTSNRVTVRIVWDNDYNESILAQTKPLEVVEMLSLRATLWATTDLLPRSVHSSCA